MVKETYSTWNKNEVLRPVSHGFYWMIIALLCIFLIATFIPSSSAIVNVSVKEKGTTYVYWEWNTGIYLTELNIDGLPVYTENSSVTKYILSPVLPNSTHFINVKTATDTGYNETTSLPEPLSSTEKLTGFLFGLIYLLITIVILIVAARIPILGFVAAIFCLIGIIKGLMDSSFLLFLVYIVAFISCFVITYERVKD